MFLCTTSSMHVNQETEIHNIILWIIIWGDNENDNTLKLFMVVAMTCISKVSQWTACNIYVIFCV